MATPEGNIGTMDDRKLAKQIEAMRDDEDAWAGRSPEPSASGSPSADSVAPW